MDLGMTVCASPVEIPYRIQQRRGRRMTARVVTGITDTRHSHFQQLRVIGSMRLVTSRAILHYRRVFPEKGAAALGMTRQTILRYRRLNQLFWIRTPVRVMTTRAGDLAFAIRHMRRALELSFPHLVTLQTQFRFRLLCAVQICQRRIEPGIGRELQALRSVSGVAVDAGYGPRLVRAPFPEQPVALLMTGEAGFILFSDRVRRVFGKANRNGFFSTSGLEVSSAWAVTRLAPESLLVRSGMCECLAHRRLLEVLALILMACHADLGADIIGTRSRRLRCFGLWTAGSTGGYNCSQSNHNQ